MNYLFDRIEKILRRLRVAKRIFFFLDYDGTLTPIVSHPEKAHLSQEMRGLLKSLKKNLKVSIAIVSGRSLEDLRNRINLKDIYYIGNHGLEIFEPKKGMRQLFPGEVVPELKRIRDRLNNLLSHIEGIVLEDKGCILALHYRNADPRWVPSILVSIKKELQNPMAPLCLGFGKYVFEVRPKLTVNKGTAVLELLGRVDQNGVLPLYIGDDQTDEDAFKVLRGRGITIFVGLTSFSTARYYVKNPLEVLHFLKMIQREFRS